MTETSEGVKPPIESTRVSRRTIVGAGLGAAGLVAAKAVSSPEVAGAQVPTPTRSPADATATAESIRLTALGNKQAEIKATATAEAALTATPAAKSAAATATAEARQAARERESRSRQEGPGFLEGAVVTGGVVGFGAVYHNRRKIFTRRFRQGMENQIIGRARRIRDWVKGRFGGAGAPPAGGAGP